MQTITGKSILPPERGFFKMSRRTDFLHFALPLIEKEELREVEDTLRSGWITSGPKVKRFEEEFADYVGARHAVAVNSCTAAMHLSLDAIGLKSGDIVFTTPYTFAATAEVVRYFKARPVFVDIDPETFNMHPQKLEQTILKTVCGKGNKAAMRAVIPVHIAGLPCELDAIHAIAIRYGLKVIEDAAHALPSRYKGAMIGGLSDLTCFSFYATKTLTTAEGGMICTADGGLADRCRIMSLHGVSRDAWKRYSSEGSWFYEITEPGFKYNMTDISAALGLQQLRKCGRMLQMRQEIAGRYTAAFSDLPEIETPRVSGGNQHAWHLYIIRLNLDRLSCSRNEFIEQLKEEKIGTSVHFIPLHLHPYYRQKYGYVPHDFPAAYELYNRVVSLPIYPAMSGRDVDDVIDAVRRVAKQNRKTPAISSRAHI